MYLGEVESIAPSKWSPRWNLYPVDQPTTPLEAPDHHEDDGRVDPCQKEVRGKDGQTGPPPAQLPVEKYVTEHVHITLYTDRISGTSMHSSGPSPGFGVGLRAINPHNFLEGQEKQTCWLPLS